jgi:hypothetical protein
MASKQLKKLQVQFCIQHDDQVISSRIKVFRYKISIF